MYDTESARYLHCSGSKFLMRLNWQTLQNEVGGENRKKSRAGVSIEGHCVLLQKFSRIKMLNFFLNSQNYRMNHIFLDILLNP